MKFTKFEPLATMLLCATMSLSMLGCKTPQAEREQHPPQITSSETRTADSASQRDDDVQPVQDQAADM